MRCEDISVFNTADRYHVPSPSPHTRSQSAAHSHSLPRTLGALRLPPILLIFTEQDLQLDIGFEIVTQA